MLTGLQEHFAGRGETGENGGVVTPAREPLDIHHSPPLNLELPEVNSLPHRLAVGGSSMESEGIGTYAAVIGSGRAVVGYFICPATNSQLAELQAIRFGLRQINEDHAEVLVANITVADSLRYIAAGKPTPYADSLADRNGIRDIARSARRIDIQVRQINSNTTVHLLSDHPLLQIADRLSLAACRIAVHGIPFDARTREWLEEIGGRRGRGRRSLRYHCDTYITRRNNPD